MIDFYLLQLSDRSTPTQLFGQFDIGLSSGDLGAFGNGIDTFALKINVITKEQTALAVPEPSASGALLISAILGLALSQQRKAKKPSRLL
ncbi:PEP-CTERM sorting domain-containing protein [Dendronalium sp. ChiSLP03b]|uniref:PEP-CTERM sorting domain-containing protein n=1 Tax=Dendronalium sp. ChiSLP03b TaxID=3075381 RepID=UPI002AD3102C|nr:PEP-CTERM sorting domain-containing protein [Dendronalium sp. ChiSLP03b]MDZ8209543.1 PEP-CTERM sorting domain-containing protein [Dendronalium sp. ChiSLP03b]